MPLQIPNLDDRRYQDLLDEAVARIPVHNPEWTNFNSSDPGVTMIEVFAFMTENLLYRANQIPERNRRKFLTLLGVPLRPASSAVGLVTISNERGPLQTVTLSKGLEVRAGQIPFRTERGFDALPIEAQVYYKSRIPNPDQRIKDYYKQLYASFTGAPFVNDADLQLYETVALGARNTSGVSLGQDTVDNSLWVALLARAGDRPAENTAEGRERLREQGREAIANKILSLGVAPSLDETSKRLAPAGQANPQSAALLQYEIPIGEELPRDSRRPRYRALDFNAVDDVLAGPGVVEIKLPSAGEMRLWTNLDPLEPGADDFPPALEDTQLNDRLITWLRIRSSSALSARLMWVGINAVSVTQRARVAGELLPAGTGEPDQVVALSRTPVVPGSVILSVAGVEWKETEDLLSAGPEVQVPDLRMPPGAAPGRPRPAEVYYVNHESGEIKFGDGMRGKRPPAGAEIRATYDYGAGAAGNVGPESINSSPVLPAGFKLSNPIGAWNGAEPEPASEGEKQIPRFLQNRDRLVNAADFEAVTLRTPGVDVGRVDVIPAYNPNLGPSEPGDSAGAVTLMVIPGYDPKQPDAPMPDRFFLNAVCRHLDPRRLVTTELIIRGPIYKAIWISVGINVLSGVSPAETREAVKKTLTEFLAPVRHDVDSPRALSLDNQAAFLITPQYAWLQKGWPLRKAVSDRELMAVASRVPGVQLVTDVIIAEGGAAPVSPIPMSGLELPRVAGISVNIGEPIDIDQLRGQPVAAGAGTVSGPKLVPVPVIPEEC
jgi:baseplate J-like protein